MPYFFNHCLSNHRFSGNTVLMRCNCNQSRPYMTRQNIGSTLEVPNSAVFVRIQSGVLRTGRKLSQQDAKEKTRTRKVSCADNNPDLLLNRKIFPCSSSTCSQSFSRVEVLFFPFLALFTAFCAIAFCAIAFCVYFALALLAGLLAKVVFLAWTSSPVQ